MAKSKTFYVTVKRDDGKGAIIAGPFEREAICREWAYSRPEDGGNIAKHHQLVKAVEEVDPRAWFYGWGMIARVYPFITRGQFNPICGDDVMPDGLIALNGGMPS